MLTLQFVLAPSAKLVIDLFAGGGGGGASTGIKQAELAKLAHATRAALRHRIAEITVLCDSGHAEEVKQLLATA